VKRRAIGAGVPVFQPETLRDPAARRALESLHADLMVVVAYGLILTPQVLAAPRLGCWNVHASLLPRWRGAAPIQRALLAGDCETGVDLMQMEKGLDTGPILLRASTPIRADDTGGSLHDRLSQMGADLLSEGLRRLDAGTLPQPLPQPEAGVCYAAKIEKHEAVLDFATQSATELERKVRAFTPWPVAETVIAGTRVRVHAARADPATTDALPGTVLRADRSGICIACGGGGALAITRLQRDGGKPVGVDEYLNAHPALRTGR
jgi:methionyl-tRNA formyltransferase